MAKPTVLPKPPQNESYIAEVPVKKLQNNKIVVMLDAGHGGEDPGAIGPRKEREKEVVLQIAKKLEKQLKNTQGIKPVLTRTGDYYLSLSERPKLAKKKYKKPQKHLAPENAPHIVRPSFLDRPQFALAAD